MLDVGVAPIFLHSDDRPRVVSVKHRALRKLRSFMQDDPHGAVKIASLVPEVRNCGDDAEALIEAGIWRAYFRLSQSVFVPATATSRVFRAVPKLSARLDDEGLIDVSGLEARPFRLFIDQYSLHWHQLLRRGFGSNIHYELA